MTKLYSELAQAYHEMYQSLFDYRQEFEFYHDLLQTYDCQTLLELGCGSGNLAPYFLERGYDYLGVDVSDDMLHIARETSPTATFLQGDMRDLHLDRSFDAIIITGRSFAYLTTNQDVMNALRSCHRALHHDGVLIFDNFRAETVMLSDITEFVHTAAYKERTYKRVSRRSLNLQTGWTWNWEAEYHIEEPGQPTRVVKDFTVLRAFTQQELQIFLALNKFRVLEVFDEDILAIVAQKQ